MIKADRTEDTMKKIDNSKTFAEEYALRKEVSRINECSWFGICIGIVIILTGSYQSLCTVGFVCVLYKILLCVGILLLLAGSFYPLVLEIPVKIIKKVFSFTGGLILKFLLLPVYLMMILINVFTRKKYSEKFRYVKWRKEYSKEPLFSDYYNGTQKKYGNATLDIINNTLSFFARNKMFTVIPLVIILLVFGLIMFFASSSAVFSFVYTLF